MRILEFRVAANDDISILVVDDDPSIRSVLLESFRDEGYRVESAS